MGLIKRIKRSWALSNKDSEVLNKLTDEQIKAIPNEGDGKAIFIGEGTEKEFEDAEKEKKGLKNVFGIGL